MLDTHGMKIKGLKKASGETCELGDYSASYIEVFYDLRTGEVWTAYQYSLGENSWTEYNESSILKICNTHHHLTMQTLADMIYDKVCEAEYYA